MASLIEIKVAGLLRLTGTFLLEVVAGHSRVQNVQSGSKREIEGE